MTIRQMLWATVTGWIEDRAPQNAAALAYYAVFSLAPLLLIAIGMAGLIFGHDAARTQILAQATSLVGADGAAALTTLLGSRESAPRAGLVSTITGFGVLLVGAVGVLAQLRSALNTVWNVDTSDTSWAALFRSYLLDFSLVVATGFLLLVSLITTAALSAATDAARSVLPGPDPVWFALDAAIGLAMTTLVFALVFKVVPDAHVLWRDVGLGALVTAVLFTLGRMALGAYLGGEGSDSAYGAAGSLLALLAWVYYSAQLVLFGAEFTYVYARRHQPKAEKS